ncbi:hypothetical protein LTR53_019589, partial [Teratosphaeriaceae sp. CCFEE 6253]
GGADNPPFRAAISERPWVQTYHNDDALEAQYKQLLKATSCADLACLRSLSSGQLNKGQQLAYVNGYLHNPRLYGFGDYWFGPSIDGNN